MNQELDERMNLMDEAISMGDTTTYWRMWSDAIEKAFATHLGADLMNKAQRQQFEGRGKVTLQQAAPVKFQDNSKSTAAGTPHGGRAHAARRQLNRCQQLANRLKNHAKLRDDKKEEAKMINLDIWDTITNKMQEEDFEVDLYKKAELNDMHDGLVMHLALKVAAGKYDKLGHRHLEQHGVESRATWRTKATDRKTGIKTISKALNGKNGRPLVAVYRPQQGAQAGPKGSIATDPAAVNEIIRDTWEEVYRGNFQKWEQQIEAFMDTYSPFIHQAPEFDVDDLTGWNSVAILAQDHYGAVLL